MANTYCISGVFVRDFEQIHGFNHALHSHEDILIDQFNKATLVFVGITRSVNYSHLFDKSTLSRLAGA